MTRYAPQWLQSGSYAASQDRRLIGALWPAPASSGCAVSASSAMTVSITPGQVAVPTQNNTGATLCSSDGPENVTLTAAPSSGSNRYDLIICRPRGNDLDGGANNDFIFDFVTGTPAASPTVPAAPAGTVALAQIYVPGGSASVTAGNITDVRPGGLATGGTGPGSGPRGYIASAVGPAVQTDCSTSATVMTLTATLTAGRRYRVSAQSLASQQTAVGNPMAILNDNAGYIAANAVRLFVLSGAGVSAAVTGSAVWSLAATASASVTFTLSGQSSAGVCRFGANQSQITVEDIGSQ